MEGWSVMENTLEAAKATLQAYSIKQIYKNFIESNDACKKRTPVTF